MILANKSHIYKKERISFVSNTQQKSTIFNKGPTLYVSPRKKYNFCEKYNHFAYKCLFKRYSPHKLVRVPKGTINHSMIDRSIYEGLKIKWVPKIKPIFL